MKRKKWTPKEDVTESVIKFREKRKWQIALRRYILERNPCAAYAPYFGLDILTIRQWIEIQFDQELTWENFGVDWQFDHIVPVVYFDFDKEEDLKLCWNFINIRIEKTGLDKERAQKVDVIAAKAYFETLLAHTGYIICKQMLDKIQTLESSQANGNKILETFIVERIDYVQQLTTFDNYDFTRLNQGENMENIILEKEILKKFGS